MSNNVKISGKPEGQIDIKRLYLPGVKVTGTCDCGKELVKDFALSCLNYPVTNEPFDVYLYCEDCDDKGIPVQVVLNVSLTIA